MENRPLYPPFSVGVDLGGTNTVYAIVDKTGYIIDKESFPTKTPTVDVWADMLADGISRMIDRHSLLGDIVGIGIGAPSANATTGSIEGATNLPWPPPVPLANLLEARLGLPVKVNNDANAAAIGEKAYGVAAGMNDFIVLTLGTGVGGGVVCNGHLLSGARGFAGELGHVTFPFAADRVCGCGRKGCLETVASARGIVETAHRLLAESDRQSSLRGIKPDELTSKIICEAALKGDELAKEVFDFTGKCLGVAAAEFASFTDPEAIILFGGVSKAGDLLINPMREAFGKHTLHLYRDRVRFLISALEGANAALIGAASLPLLK
ncbi:MAG: ROK family protein [Muribaculaceae bacterium]|nr:ROK family protein [Muribaculaceae bacterium]